MIKITKLLKEAVTDDDIMDFEEELPSHLDTNKKQIAATLQAIEAGAYSREAAIEWFSAGKKSAPPEVIAYFDKVKKDKEESYWQKERDRWDRDLDKKDRETERKKKRLSKSIITDKQYDKVMMDMGHDFAVDFAGGMPEDERIDWESVAWDAAEGYMYQVKQASEEGKRLKISDIHDDIAKYKLVKMYLWNGTWPSANVAIESLADDIYDGISQALSKLEK